MTYRRYLYLLALIVLSAQTTACSTGNGPSKTLCVRDQSRSEVMGNPVGHETAARRVVKARNECRNSQ